MLTTPEADTYAMTLEAARAGFQTCIHAIGDRGNRVAMDVFERVASEVPAARALRQRNEHAQILDAQEIPRFKALDVIASIQPTHCTSDMPWVPARIGAQRTAEGAYVWRKLARRRRAPRQRVRLPGRGAEPDARPLRRDHAPGPGSGSRPAAGRRTSG